MTLTFAHPWWLPFTTQNMPRCLDEWFIIGALQLVRAKPQWQAKYKDDMITLRWRRELAEQADRCVTPAATLLDYVFRELEWYDRQANRLHPWQIARADDRVVFCDEAVDEDTKHRLQAQLAELEALMPKDYHPGSNETVVDLVHPSLYPLVYGTSEVDGQPATPKLFGSVADWGRSERFQWLPCVMKLTDNGFAVSSYINNLEKGPLYDTLATVFNAALPGLDYVLTRSALGYYLRIPVSRDYVVDEYHKKEDELYEREDRDDPDDDFDIDEALEELEEQKVNYLKPFEFADPAHPPMGSPFVARDHPELKVIVKLANIELTPDKPRYAGGAWHVEGTANEHIVATILYYYDLANITDSQLMFREAYEDPPYEQNDGTFCEKVYGLEDGQLTQKTLGGVPTTENRVLVFPNMMQHKVDAFELLDPTKPGHRKIVAMFVVDPYDEGVVATDRVEPQQRKFTREQAEAWRTELMAERLQRVTSGDFDNVYEREFSLCEH